MWFKGGLSIFKVMSKRTYFIDVVKDYGNTNYLCYNKHHIWSMDVQDQLSICVNNNWVPQHITIDLFETPNISQTTLAKIVKPFLIQFQFIDKLLTYVKDERNNLNTFENGLSTTTSYKLLKLQKPFEGKCFGHVMNKVWENINYRWEGVCINERNLYQKSPNNVAKTIT